MKQKVFNCIVYRDPEKVYKYEQIITDVQLVQDYENACANKEDVDFLRQLINKGKGDEAIRIIANAWGLDVHVYQKVYECKRTESDKMKIWPRPKN